MPSTTRVPKAPVTGLTGHLVRQLSKRQLGKVPESIGVMWHNKPVLMAVSSFGRKVATWDRLDPNLASFAHMAAAAQVGCSFCLDLQYFMAHNEGLDVAKASQVPRWRVSDVFTPLERDVMEYAEAMSQTPPTVSDELSGRLLEQLGAPALVELTACVGFANLTARSNIAVGITSEGFSASCEVPLAQPSTTSAGAA